MSCKTENRGFAVGREVGRCGRCTRFVLGLLGLVYIAAQVLQARLSGALIGQVAGGALLSTTLYVIIFWALGERVFAHVHPWLRTGMCSFLSFFSSPGVGGTGCSSICP